MNNKEKIISFVHKKGQIKSSEVVEILQISRQRALILLQELVKTEELIKFGTTKTAFYTTKEQATTITDKITKKLQNENVEEYEVLKTLEKKSPLLSLLSDNIKSIFDYAFSEMTNNAIDHSFSKTFTITVGKTDNLVFDIKDSGIGIFHNIQKNKNLADEIEAIAELLKGKTTTMPQAHSGEGIFFTSKIADFFTLESHKLKLVIDNRNDDITVIPLNRFIKGTRVHFEINLKSSKHISDVFLKYQSNPDELAFDTTDIHVRLYIMGSVHVSRSQARRILNNLDKFKVITLDFDKVPNIGQAFADEIFRIFQKKYPDIKIIPVNTNETVNFMIQRAINTKR